MKRKTKLVNTEYFFVHCKKKNEIFKPFHQNKFSTELIKTISYLRRRNILDENLYRNM